MCFSKAPKVQPVRSAPAATPEIIDEVAVSERDANRERQRLRYGRQATIIAGQGGASTGAPATTPAKAALGS